LTWKPESVHTFLQDGLKALLHAAMSAGKHATIPAGFPSFKLSGLHDVQLAMLQAVWMTCLHESKIAEAPTCKHDGL
jgi:hypothetical protein